jgi:transcriptional regulator with XRE-family HTH domain
VVKAIGNIRVLIALETSLRVLPIHEIDRLVGERMRLRREALGLSRRHFGRTLGITSYQVQKYENGSASIGAGRLSQIAIVLKVPISFFFEDIDNFRNVKAESQSGEVQELARFFNSIQDGTVRRTLLELMRSISGDAEPHRRQEQPRQ